MRAIWAQDLNGVMGKDGGLPWRIPEDLQYFKKITGSSDLIMGRKTFESLPGVLPNRRHIVVSSDKSLESGNVIVVDSIPESFEVAPDGFIIGGGEILKAALPYLSEIFLTLVDVFVDGDNLVYAPGLEGWVIALDGRWVESRSGLRWKTLKLFKE